MSSSTVEQDGEFLIGMGGSAVSKKNSYLRQRQRLGLNSRQNARCTYGKAFRQPGDCDDADQTDMEMIDDSDDESATDMGFKKFKQSLGSQLSESVVRSLYANHKTLKNSDLFRDPYNNKDCPVVCDHDGHTTVRNTSSFHLKKYRNNHLATARKIMTAMAQKQQGSICKFNPREHDSLINEHDLQTDMRRKGQIVPGSVLMQVFDQLRKSTIGTRLKWTNGLPKREGLQIYLHLTPEESIKRVTGVVAWCKFDSSEYREETISEFANGVSALEKGKLAGTRFADLELSTQNMSKLLRQMCNVSLNARVPKGSTNLLFCWGKNDDIQKSLMGKYFLQNYKSTGHVVSMWRINKDERFRKIDTQRWTDFLKEWGFGKHFAFIESGDVLTKTNQMFRTNIAPMKLRTLMVLALIVHHFRTSVERGSCSILKPRKKTRHTIIVENSDMGCGGSWV